MQEPDCERTGIFYRGANVIVPSNPQASRDA
jgi:hypothetical protein